MQKWACTVLGIQGFKWKEGRLCAPEQGGETEALARLAGPHACNIRYALCAGI